MNSNNSIAVIVVGLLGFLAIIITGKWLLDRKDHCDHPPVVQVAPQQPQQPPRRQQSQQPQVIVQPPPPQIIIGQPYPHSYPHHHNKHEFWQGYSDGWNGIPMRQHCPEYAQGYQIGQHDRRCNRPRYHEQHCPPGFTLRTPGFSLNIR